MNTDKHRFYLRFIIKIKISVFICVYLWIKFLFLLYRSPRAISVSVSSATTSLREVG